ncbi:MAG: transposase [Chlamydiae bacterium]|nr:transposase [Chlamydiota bacterium]
MSKETNGLKLLIEPQQEEQKILDGQSRICNWLYNDLLDKAQTYKKEFKEGNKESGRTLYTKRGFRNLLPQMKEHHPFLKEVHSSPLKNAALRCSDAIRTHQKSKKGLRKGKLVGWPKFRGWKRKWFSLFYDEPTKGFSIEGQTLKLSLGMGEDRKQRSIEIPLPEAAVLKDKKIRNLRIIFELGKYFAVFTIEKEMQKLKPLVKVIALDPNHKNLAYGVDTEKRALEIEAPLWLKNYDKRIDELKSKRDRCNKKSKKVAVLDTKGNPIGKVRNVPSKQWLKRNDTLQRALHKRREQTKTFMFTAAHKLFKEYDCVAIGDYTPNGGGLSRKMRRAMNNRSLIGRFKQVLSWVGKKSGKLFLEFDEKGTTRTCCKCNAVVEGGLSPKIRVWQCSECQTMHIRDENAAVNGLGKVLRDLATKSETIVSHIVSGSDLFPVKERWAWCVLPSGVIITPRGQDGDHIAATGN